MIFSLFSCSFLFPSFLSSFLRSFFSFAIAFIQSITLTWCYIKPYFIKLWEWSWREDANPLPALSNRKQWSNWILWHWKIIVRKFGKNQFYLDSTIARSEPLTIIPPAQSSPELSFRATNHYNTWHIQRSSFLFEPLTIIPPRTFITWAFDPDRWPLYRRHFHSPR